MVRTTHHAGWLIAALATLSGLRATHAPSAEPQPHQPVSVVAQSTKATAGTGRRPIGERIVASNLPQRAPAAQPPLLNNAPIAAEPPLPDHAPIAAEPPLPDEGSEDAVADTAPEMADTESAGLTLAESAPAAEATEPAVIEAEPATGEAAVVTLPGSVAKDAVVQVVDAETDDTVEAGALAEATAAAAAPVPASTHAEPKSTDAVRKNLLHRIKSAFAARPRAIAGAASPLGTAAPVPAVAETPASPQHLGADTAAATPAPEAVAAPARLEFDVRESRSLVGEGEQIVMRIAVRNVGGATAERVTTTLFFADGIEPVQAIGHSAEVYPGEVRFATVPELSPGSSVDLLVTAVGTRPGSVGYRGELACDQLAGLIAREGAVTVQPRRAPTP